MVQSSKFLCQTSRLLSAHCKGSVAGWAIPYIIFASSVGVNASLWTSALTRFIKLLPVALMCPKCNKCTFVFKHSQWNLVFHQLLHSKTLNQ